MKVNKIILGSIVALLSFGIIVFVIETDKSFLQLAIGFIVFIFPITFISSFETTASVFFLVLFTLLFIYLGIYKYEYFDILFGLLLAGIIGGALSYYRVEKYKLFSLREYKKTIKSSSKEN